jgi:hypothetical protein
MIEAAEAYRKHGSKDKAARALDIAQSTYEHRLRKAKAAGLLTDPAVKAGMDSIGTGLVPSGMWVKTPATEDQPGYSLYLRPETEGGLSLPDLIRETWDDLKNATPSSFPLRDDPSGEHLLRIGLADVHVGKLSVENETGFTYNRDIAVHRMVEGTKALLAKAKPHGIGRILLPIGNDMLHVDGPRSQTTSGTYQDTHGSIRQMYSAGKVGLVKVIELCADVAPVDLIYVPSNHDWLMGWALAGDVATWFRNDPRVTASEYGLSERHRKYYRFGRNLLGETHGDGAKEADLYSLMMTEARAHISECLQLYWYVGHTHHKYRRAQGVTAGKREKDHIGMTMVNARPPEIEGDNVMVETVRSPSPPDGWHDRNGYVNRQAVECFLHDPIDGQVARFTEWF